MPFLWALLTLALHLFPGAVVPTHGQGSRKDDIVFNSRGIPLAGATVRVCTMPASGQPCTPLAQIYSDAGLTQAIANPTTTDGLGNYFFYAAPGKYEIEVSGPGITTKQLPNVILPNDPSSPTFTGAVSAFSLSLGGNLSVTGNTAVVGSLASGTLNLANQSTPPGAANSGTVNLYTKTADKRLYYKDDTGTEVGPISSASGAQTNVVNTFTATQNFDADFETKGPNPYFSLSRYGGYSSASAPTTSGTISSGSTTLTLANAQDFANGQGIMIYKAGPATALATPGQPTVTPINLLNGSTTYNYAAIAEDRSGGLTAASTTGTTTGGAATLGANSVTLTQCQRTNGVATYTSSTNHNLQSGAQINISGFSGGVFDGCNGVKTIASTPTSTTFTTNDGGLPNETNTTGSPVVTVYACNTLTFPNGSFSGISTIHYWIYRSIGGGSFSLVGVAQGADPWWQDCGRPAPTVNGYVPATPPGSAQPGYLATTIVSGGGTTTLTLANAASTSATSQVVLHDNSVPLKNAVQAATNANGGTVYIPNAGNQSWVFNGTTDFNSGITFTAGIVRVHLNSSAIFLNNPWIVRSGMDFEGEPRTTSSFTYVNGSQMIAVGAYPLFLLPETGGGSTHYSRLVLVGNQPQQTVMYADEGQDGGGVAGIVWDDVTFIGNNGSTNPVVLKGGFDFFFNRGNCQGEPGTNFVPVSCLQLTNSSTAVTGGGPGQVPGRVKLRGIYFSGNAIDIDCLPNSQNVAPFDYTFDTTIFESATAPYLRLNCSTGQFGGIALTDVVQADSIVGFGTPSIDSQNAGVQLVSWSGGAVNSASQPALIVSGSNGSASLQLFNAPFSNYGNAPYTVLSGPISYSTGAFASTGSGRSESVLAGPAAPSLALGSGGSVPTGTMNYVILWLDADGNYTSASPAAAANVTSGNQTVTITIPSAPAGAVGWLPFRAPTGSGPSLLNVQSLGTCGSVFASGIPLSTTSFVDSSSFTCGTTLPLGTPAGATILGPNGVSGPKIRLVNNGNILSTTFPNSLSANRTLSIPDNSGYLPITSYVNTGYDNFHRANGGLGTNWTTYRGLTAPTITGNQIVGNSGGSQSAIWNANSFAADQFAPTISVRSLQIVRIATLR
jgi:hypothetical protein